MLAFKTLKGAGWLVASRFSGRIIDFFTLLLFARILTPADFGLAALAMSVVLVVDTVLEAPVTQALVRLKGIDKSHLDTGFTLSCIRSGLVALLVLSAAWPFSILNHDPMLAPLIAVLAIGPVVKGLNSPAMVHFTRGMRFKQTFVMEFSGKICAFGVASVVVLSGGAYWAIAINFVGAAVASTIASYIMAPYRPTFSLARLRDFLGFVGWFSSAQLVSALNWQFDRFLIGASTDNTTMGRYAIANDMAVIPTQSLIGPALQPVMAAFSQIASEPERLRIAFLKAARFAMLISVPASVGIFLTADLIIELLLGAKWASAAPLLSVLALSIIPIPYFQTLYSASLATNRPNIIFKINVIDLSVRLIIIPIGFMIYSTEGVAFARVLLSWIMFGVFLNEAKRLLKLNILVQLKNIWKIMIAGGIMVIWVLLLRSELAPLLINHIVQLLIVAATGAAVYVGVLLALGMRLVFGRGRLELIGH